MYVYTQRERYTDKEEEEKSVWNVHSSDARLYTVYYVYYYFLFKLICIRICRVVQRGNTRLLRNNNNIIIIICRLK